MKHIYTQMKHILTLSLALPLAFTAAAHTDLLNQNFDGEYLVDFPIVLELDHLPPLANVNPLFQNEAGVAQPWWPLKDSSSSDDRFLCSHSAYQYAGASNDWIGSRAIKVPSEGFVLSFGAQSYVMRDGDRLSDLWLFITEEPLNADNLPTEPTMHIEKIGLGADAEILEGDFIPYELNLDPWTGKTIYINFANLNEGRDILAIDNVLIRRQDIAEVNIQGPGEYVVQGEYTVSATIRGTEAPGLGAWTLTFDDGNGNTDVRTGDALAAGDEFSFEFTGVAEAGKVSEYSVSLASDDIPAIPASGTLTGLAFLPVHRVFYEESTGVWCGNCPLGSYTIESIMTDPEMKDRVVPISIHIPGTGSDYMVNEDYVAQFGLTAAPLTRTEREEKVLGFSNLDRIYDPSNPNTAAGRLRTYADRVTIADISLSAAYSVADVYPPHLMCEVTVRPAIDMEGQYAVGLVMTENNVTFNHPSWYQSNYASGDDIEGDMGGWTKLPAYVKGMRYQDVARGIWGYNGIEGSLPALLPMNQDITFQYEIEVPDTYRELTEGDPSTAIAPAINQDNVVMVAFLVDQKTGFIINAVSYPMSPSAEERFTIADVLAEAGVDGITVSGYEGETEYYNLQGIRLSSPVKGQPVIVRQGNTVSKRIFR